MTPPLRLALVPIGIVIASKGLQALTEEAERLDREIAARRAALGIIDPEQAAEPWDELEDPPRHRVRRDVGRLVAAAVGFSVGAYLAMRAQRALQDRAAAELGIDDELAAELARVRAEEAPAAPVATEPGCLHPDCILTHPHAGPAKLAPVPAAAGHAYPCPDDCTCKQ